MKTVNFLCICLLVFSCSNDDDDTAQASNTIEYDGNRYEVTTGALIDFGQSQSNAGFKEYSLQLANDDIDITFINNPPESYSINTNQSSVLFSVNLYANNTENTINGTYYYRISDSGATTNYNKGVFIHLDTDMDGSNNVSEYIPDGIVTITGPSPSYVITVDSRFLDETPLKFTFRGSLELFEAP